MGSLSDLFDGAGADDAPPRPASPVDLATTTAQLRRMVGASELPDARSDPVGSATLRDLVGPATPAGSAAAVAAADFAGHPTGSTPGAGTKTPRRRTGPDLLSLIVAVIAIVAVVGSVGAAVAVRAATGPADAALASLREQEADLSESMNALETARARYEAAMTDAGDLAVRAESVLAGLEGKTDEAARAGAVAALAAFRDTLAGEAPPQDSPEWQRPVTDAASLESIARALDDVNRVIVSTDELVATTRAARMRVTDAQTAFIQALTRVGQDAAIVGPRILAENPDAGRAFHDAVTRALSAVTVEQAAARDGVDQLAAYAAAVDALRVEQERVVAENTAREEEERRRSRGGTWRPAPPAGEPVPEQPVEPTDPAAPVDPVEPTDPVDPTDPTTPGVPGAPIP